MNPLTALDQSIAITQRVIDAGPITASVLASPTPCEEFDAAQLLDHIVDTHVFLLTAAGGRVELDDESIAAKHASVGAAAVAAWTARGDDGTIDLGGNQLPASFGLSLHALEAFIHGWDLAQSLDRPFEPSDELVSAALVLAREVISDQMRGDFEGAPYGPAVPTVGSADELQLLVAHAGRTPLRRFSAATD